MALIRWIAAACLALTVLYVCVLNQQNVSVHWSLTHASAALPLSALLLAVFMSGFLAGAAALWMNTAAVRRHRKKQDKKQNKAPRLFDGNLAGQSAKTVCAGPAHGRRDGDSPLIAHQRLADESGTRH